MSDLLNQYKVKYNLDNYILTKLDGEDWLIPELKVNCMQTTKIKFKCYKIVDDILHFEIITLERFITNIFWQKYASSDSSNGNYDVSNEKYVSKKVVVYLENWGQNITKQSYDIIIKNATHIVVAFATNYKWGPQRNTYFTCDSYINFTVPIGFNTHKEFITYAKNINKNIKILMSYGGRDLGCCPNEGNNYWKQYCTDTDGTAELMIQTMLKNNYDGIDLDWEVPSSDILYKIIEYLANKFKSIKTSENIKPLLSIVPIADYFFPDITLYVDGESKYSYFNIFKTFKDDIDIISIQAYNTPLAKPQIAAKLKNGIFSCMHYNNVLESIGNPNKIVILICNDGGIADGCGWDTNGSNSTPNITVNYIHCLYNKINKNYGGLGIWAMQILSDNTIKGANIVPLLKTAVTQSCSTSFNFSIDNLCINNNGFSTSDFCNKNKNNCNQCGATWIGDAITNPSINSSCAKQYTL